MISLLHTTARPHQWRATAEGWMNQAAAPEAVEHVLTFESRYFDGVVPTAAFDGSIVEMVSGSVVSGWNRAAELATGEIFVMVADDLTPCMGWDKFIGELIGDQDREAVLWVRNVRQVDGDGEEELFHWNMCHPVLTKRYWERYGYFLHPAYFARYADKEFTDQAMRDGVVVDARKDPRIWFRHQWDLESGKTPDDVGKIIHDKNELGAATYAARKAMGFPKHVDQVISA